MRRTDKKRHSDTWSSIKDYPPDSFKQTMPPLNGVFTEKPDPHQGTGPLCSVYYLYIYVIVRRILHIKSEIFIAKCLDKVVMNLFYSLISARGLFPR